MKTDQVYRAILGQPGERFVLPRKLIATDRVLQRWAVSVGSGLPTEEWDDNPRARVSPLPDNVAIDVDQCVLRSPAKTLRLVTLWYKTPQPVEVIGSKIGLSGRSVYRAHGVCLEFMRGRFLATDNSDLIKLVETLDP